MRLFKRPRCEPATPGSGNRGEPPPDIAVREPRRPLPPGFGGAAVLDPPSEVRQQLTQSCQSRRKLTPVRWYRRSNRGLLVLRHYV